MNKPTKPNITIPASFGGVKVDFDNNHLTNGFPQLTPDVLPGDCLNKLIDDTYKGLNYAMAGTDAINLIQEDEVLTVKNGELVSSKQAGGWTPSLLQSFWTDHLLNRMDMLRSDTFSWQSGATYSSVYNELLSEYNNASSTTKTDTVGNVTITYKLTPKGYKICAADQVTSLTTLYNNTGIAWYYVLDTANKQFKLPRTKWGFKGLRDNVGNTIAESLPNITGYIDAFVGSQANTGVFSQYKRTISAQGGSSQKMGVDFNASSSSSIYQDGAPVQERATQMYLYFYVGEFTQTAIEQTAGLNAELFNGKQDVCVHIINTYVNGTSWYRIWSDGYCEQGGVITKTTSSTSYNVTLLKTYKDTAYCLQITDAWDSTNNTSGFTNIKSKTTSSFKVALQNLASTYGASWRACGYIS